MELLRGSKKRSRSPSDPPWRRLNKDIRREPSVSGSTNNALHDGDFHERKKQENFVREQTRLNQIEEAEQMREWVSKEDDFVLRQSKKKAQIRVREGRAKPIDWLAIVLSVVDPIKDLLDDDSTEPELDVIDPEGVIEDLDHAQLLEIEKEIDSYHFLETNTSNRAYWQVRTCHKSLLALADHL